MTVLIDPATGLPQLPDDHFFRVKDKFIEIIQRLPQQNWSEWIEFNPMTSPRENVEQCASYYAQLEMHDEDRWSPYVMGTGVAVEKKSQVDTERRKVFLFFWKNEPVTKTYYRYRPNPYEVIRIYGNYSEDATTDSREYHGNPEDAPGVPMTEKNLVTRASNLVAYWNSLLEAEKLFGDYPPKKLEN